MNATYRLDELTEALEKMKINRLDILVTGDTSAGKSSTLNTILEKMSAKVGEGVEPETKDVTSYSLNDKLYFWDTPGFGDGVENDKKHAQKITDLLNKFYGERAKIGYIDLVLVIIDGSKRDMGTTYQMLTDVILPNFPKDRILVAINQSDLAMKGRHWNGEDNAPDDELQEFLLDKAFSVKRRIKEATDVEINEPICFSAKHNYNTSGLLDLIFDNLPKSRRLYSDSNMENKGDIEDINYYPLAADSDIAKVIYGPLSKSVINFTWGRHKNLEFRVLSKPITDKYDDKGAIVCYTGTNELKLNSIVYNKWATLIKDIGRFILTKNTYGTALVIDTDGDVFLENDSYRGRPLLACAKNIYLDEAMEKGGMEGENISMLVIAENIFLGENIYKIHKGKRGIFIAKNIFCSGIHLTPNKKFPETEKEVIELYGEKATSKVKSDNEKWQKGLASDDDSVGFGGIFGGGFSLFGNDEECWVSARHNLFNSDTGAQKFDKNIPAAQIYITAKDIFKRWIAMNQIFSREYWVHY